MYIVNVEPYKALPFDWDVLWNRELMTWYQGASRGYSSTVACVFLKNWRKSLFLCGTALCASCPS